MSAKPEPTPVADVDNSSGVNGTNAKPPSPYPHADANDPDTPPAMTGADCDDGAPPTGGATTPPATDMGGGTTPPPPTADAGSNDDGSLIDLEVGGGNDGDPLIDLEVGGTGHGDNPLIDLDVGNGVGSGHGNTGNPLINAEVGGDGSGAPGSLINAGLFTGGDTGSDALLDVNVLGDDDQDDGDAFIDVDALTGGDNGVLLGVDVGGSDGLLGTGSLGLDHMDNCGC